VPAWSRYLVPFAAGVAVGVLAHKYWPQIREAVGPAAKKGLRGGSGLVDRARTAFWEKSEKFSDLIAEIREEEEAKAKGPTPPPPPTEPQPA
jgi:hypothetical protein